MNGKQLAKIMPLIGYEADKLAPLFTQAMVEFGINSPKRQAAFLATVAHESADFTRFEEGMNYSAAGLMATWPSRFPTLDSAQPFHRKPINIANYVYANRGGNGDVASGDGWRFRGAGAIQLTFRNNQELCAKYFKVPVSEIGAWLRTREGAIRSAAWFWKVNGCNELADDGRPEPIRQRVNGGLIGLKEFVAKLLLAKEALA